MEIGLLLLKIRKQKSRNCDVVEFASKEKGNEKSTYIKIIF